MTFDLYVTAELHTECSKQAAANNSGSPKCVQAESCTAVGACHKMDVWGGVGQRDHRTWGPPASQQCSDTWDRRRTGINPRYVSLTAPTRKHQRCSNPNPWGPPRPTPCAYSRAHRARGRSSGDGSASFNHNTQNPTHPVGACVASRARAATQSRARRAARAAAAVHART